MSEIVVPTGPTLGAGASTIEVASVGASPWRRRASLAGWYALLLVLSAVVLFPIYVTLIQAVSNPAAYYQAHSPLHPVQFDLHTFRAAWDDGQFSRTLLVSLIVTLGITAGQVVTSILAAYAFTFLEFPFKRLAFGLCIATLMLPIEVTLIPNIETIRNAHWLDTYQGLVVPFLASALGIFLVRQGFKGLPRDLRDAATLDGYGHLRFLTRVAVPLSRPVIASFTVIAFLAAWNQYLWPNAATETDRWHTVQIGIAGLKGANASRGNIPLAGALIAAVPIVALLIVFSRQIIRGLTAGAVKG